MPQKKWVAVEIFINNEPNRIVIKRNGWKGRVIADCGPVCPATVTDANMIADALNRYGYENATERPSAPNHFPEVY